MTDTKNNTGTDNSGNCNSGNCNSGNCNSGDCNSGNWNSGDWNSGDWNSGDWNSGNCNSGNCNSGYRNSGDWNSGNWNSGYRNSGYFNSDEPTVRMFNRDTGKMRSEINLPSWLSNLAVTEWVGEDNMTDQQKKDNPKFFAAKGFLLTRTYKEAWAKLWSEITPAQRREVEALPNFDAAIFEEITGIKIGGDDTKKRELMAKADELIAKANELKQQAEKL